MKKPTFLFAAMAVLLASLTYAAEEERHRFPDEGIRRILVSTVTESSATINWLTEDSEVDEVCAWTQDQKVLSASDEQATREHSLTLTGLAANAVYHFVVRGASGCSHAHWFQTVEPLPGKPDFVMGVVADPQFDGEASGGGVNFARVVEALNEMQVDFVVFPGDLVDNRNKAKKIEGFTLDVHGFTKAFQAFKNIADGLAMPYYVAPGNHERLHTPGTREAYTKMFGLEKAYYSVDLRGRHFVFIDCKPDEKQVAWLVADLKANRDKDVFVVLHYAVANDPYVFDRGRGVMPKIQKLFEEHGRLRAVYNGHKNVMSATVQSGILYVSCPQPSSTPGGYLIVRVYSDGLIQTFQSTPGVRPQLRSPLIGQTGEAVPDRLRWDSGYRWGRQAARNFTWRYGEPATSTGIK